MMKKVNLDVPEKGNSVIQFKDTILVFILLYSGIYCFNFGIKEFFMIRFIGIIYAREISKSIRTEKL